MLPAITSRQRGYLQLLTVCLLVLAAFTLPYPWSRLSTLGYLLMGLVMIRVLGNPEGDLQLGPWPRLLFRGLGVAALSVNLIWAVTPPGAEAHRRTGDPALGPVQPLECDPARALPGTGAGGEWTGAAGCPGRIPYDRLGRRFALCCP